MSEDQWTGTAQQEMKEVRSVSHCLALHMQHSEKVLASS